MGEDELRRQVERAVRLLLYRPDGAGVDPTEVVLKLADYICDSLGRRVVEGEVRTELERHGYHLRDWARDQNVLQQVERLNGRYLRHVQSELIFGRAIPRAEAESVPDALQSTSGKLAQIIIGAAGRGKTCTLAQIVEHLRRAGVPFLVIRLDDLPPLSSTRALGRELDLPDSPALVLAGLAYGKRAVLVIDQLDAVSVVSGRNAELWQVFDELLEEVRHHPNLRLLLASREFDLENDPRLAKLVKDEGPANRVHLGLLSVDTVKSVVSEAGGQTGRLSARELEMLRLPFRLYLLLQGEPGDSAPFGGRQELFARFWKTKRAKANQANVDFEKVVGVLSEQHLFRRAQVRQILAYQRDDDRTVYVRTLRALLNEPRVRLHLKKLALDWLAQLDDPTEEEWNLVMPLLTNPQLHWAAFNVLWAKLPWFDLLQGIGVLSELLGNPDPDFVDRCIRALSQKEFMEQRSADIENLLRLYRGKGEVWDRRFRAVLQFGHFHHSDEMFGLVLNLQQDGLLDDDEDDLRWHSLTEMAEQRPDFAVEFLGRKLERMISQARARGESNPFSGEQQKRKIDRIFIHTTAERAPVLFARRIAPIVKDLVLSNARPARCGGYYDQIWQYLSFGTERDTDDALLGSLRRALKEFARSNPEGCDALLAGWEEFDHKTLRFLLLSAWLGNPAYFAARAAEYFVRHSLAFLVGYDFIIGDEPGGAGITLPLLKAISPLIDADAHAKLETALHGYTAPFEKQKPQYRGSHELSLWVQLAPDRLSQRSRMRIDELQRKFPERKLTPSETRRGRQSANVGFVPPPTSCQAGVIG